MPSHESRYWERKDEEAAESEASSGSGSGEDEDEEEEGGNGTGSRVGSAPVWPQSYRCGWGKSHRFWVNWAPNFVAGQEL